MCLFSPTSFFRFCKIKVITNMHGFLSSLFLYLLPNRSWFCTYSSHSALILLIDIYSHQGLTGPSQEYTRGGSPVHPSSPHTGIQYVPKSLRRLHSAWCAWVWLWVKTGEPVDNMWTPQRRCPSPQSFTEPPFSRIGEIELARMARIVARKWPLLFITCPVSLF